MVLELFKKRLQLHFTLDSSFTHLRPNTISNLLIRSIEHTAESAEFSAALTRFLESKMTNKIDSKSTEIIISAVSNLKSSVWSNHIIRRLIDSIFSHLEQCDFANLKGLIQFISSCFLGGPWLIPFRSRINKFLQSPKALQTDVPFEVLNALSESDVAQFRALVPLLIRSETISKIQDCVAEHVILRSEKERIPFEEARLILWDEIECSKENADSVLKSLSYSNPAQPKPDFFSKDALTTSEQLALLAWLEADVSEKVAVYADRLNGPFVLKALKLAHSRNEQIDTESFERYLLEYVRSPFHLDRLWALEVLGSKERDTSKCLECEKLSLSMETDRIKISCLTKLDHGFVGDDVVAISFLLGTLKENYSRLWDVTNSSLRSFATMTEFWEIVFGELFASFDEFIVSTTGSSYADRALRAFDLARNQGRKFDRSLFRLNLWKMVDGINEISAENQRRIMGITLDSIENVGETRDKSLAIQLGILQRFKKEIVCSRSLIQPLISLLSHSDSSIARASCCLLLTRVLSIPKTTTSSLLALFEPNLKWNLHEITPELNAQEDKLQAQILSHLLIRRLNSDQQTRQSIVQCVFNLSETEITQFIQLAVVDVLPQSDSLKLIIDQQPEIDVSSRLKFHTALKLLRSTIDHLKSPKICRTVFDEILSISAYLSTSTKPNSCVRQLQRLSLGCLRRFFEKRVEFELNTEQITCLNKIVLRKMEKMTRKLEAFLIAISETVNCSNLFTFQSPDHQPRLIEVIVSKVDDEPTVALLTIVSSFLNSADFELNHEALVRRLDSKMMEIVSGTKKRQSKHSRCLFDKCVELISMIVQQNSPIESSDYRKVLLTHMIHVLGHHRYFEETTISSVLKIVRKYVSEDYCPVDSFMIVRTLSPLLSELSEKSTRSSLFGVLKIIANRENYGDIGLIRDLSAYRIDRLDEIDFEKRSNAYCRLSQLLASESAVSKPFLYLLVHSLPHLLRKSSEEMSFRGLLIECAKSLIELVSNDCDLLSRLITEIHSGLKNKQLPQAVHFGCLKLVRVLAIESLRVPDKFPVWVRQISLLLNETNVEIDFIENFTHIQLHRRTRSLGVLQESLDKIGPQCISEFVRPLLSYAIENGDKYVQEKSAEVLGLAIGHLPWAQQRRTLTNAIKQTTDDLSNNQLLLSLARNLQINEKFEDPAVCGLLKLTQRLIFDSSPQKEKLKPALVLILVRLLKQIPNQQIFRANLNNVILKLIERLKIRSFLLRKQVRLSLLKLLLELKNPDVLRYIISEMQSILKRGYEVHILVYTTNELLRESVGFLETGDLDEILDNLIDIFNRELFANREEKEALKIGVREAAAISSYAGYGVLSRFVSRSRVMRLFERGLSDQVTRAAYLSTVSDCLNMIRNGMQLNCDLDISTKLVVIHGIAQMALPHCFPAVVDSTTAKKVNDPVKHCALIPNEPTRRGSVKPNPKNGASTFLSFALQYLETLVKSNYQSLSPTSVDPLFELVVKSLDCRSGDVLVRATKCLNTAVNLEWADFPGFLKNSNTVEMVRDRIMRLIDTNVVAQSSDLLPNAFKLLASLIKHYGHADGSIADRLLTYCDMRAFSGDPSALILLKSILKQHLIPSELKPFMMKLVEEVLRNATEFNTLQIERIFGEYLKNYELKVYEIENFVLLIAPNLCSDYSRGREVSCALLGAMVNILPPKTVTMLMPTLLVGALAALANESDNERWRKNRELLRSVLVKVDRSTRQGQVDRFLNVAISAKQQSLEIRMASFQALTVLLEIDSKTISATKINEVYTAILSEFENINNNKDQAVTTTNKFVSHALDLLIESLNHHFASALQSDSAFSISNFVLAQTDVDLRLKALDFTHLALTKLSAPTPHQIQNLVRRHCQVLRSTQNETVADKVARNLFRITQSVLAIEDSPKILRFIIARVRREGDLEASSNVTSIMSRQAALKFIASLTMILDRNQLHPFAPIIVPLIQREIGQDKNEKLETLANEAWSAIEAVYGNDHSHQLIETYNAIKASRTERKLKRKQQLAVGKIANPGLHAERKLKKRKKKEEKKKRRMSRKIN